MPGNLGEHVIEERYARCRLALTCTVQIEGDLDIGFPGLTRLCRRSRIHQLFSNALLSARRNRSFSSGSPIDTLRHLCSKGYELTSRTSTPWVYNASNNSFAGFAVLINKKFAFDGNTSMTDIFRSSAATLSRSPISVVIALSSVLRFSITISAAASVNMFTLYG